MKKAFKIFFISLLIIVSLVTGTAFVIGYFYEDEVVGVVLNELNKNIKTEINIGSYDFSVLSKFPDASLEFKDITAKSTKNFKSKRAYEDTLFTAKSIFLQFNIFDIIKKHYTINAIHIDGADVRIITNKKGQENFHFWVSDSTSTSNFKLELNSVKITETKVDYINYIKRADVKIYTDKFTLNGNFTSDTYILKSKGKLDIKKLEFDNVNYATADNISLKSDIKVDNNTFTIKQGQLNLNNLSFNLDGVANYENKLNLDIKLSGDDIDIKSLLSVLPDVAKSSISSYKSDGLFYFNGSIKGEVSNYKSPSIETDFGINNAIITNTNSNIKLTNVNAKGKWSNGSRHCAETSFLQLNSLDANLNGNKISGNYKITNFKSPTITVNSDINTELNELISFLDVDTIESISGKLAGHINFTGKFKDFNNITNADIARSKTSGYANLSNVSLKLKDSDFEIKNINSGLKFNSKSITIDSLRFKQGNNDFFIKGFLYNILQYFLINDKDIRLSGTLKSDNFDLDEFLNYLRDKNAAKEKSTNINVEEYITYKLKFDVKNFKYKKFEGKNLKGSLRYYEKTISINDISINTLEGNFSGNVFLQKIDSNKFKFTANPVLKNININKMFTVFDNFGQDFIKAENLKGIINSKNKLSFFMNKKAEIDETSLNVLSDIEIKNGELNHFKPMRKLSRFIALSELENIKFSTLKNQIRIENKTIYIPKMDIKSSAFTITAGGEHHFNGKYNYKLKVLLSDVLLTKAKRAKKQNTEFGVIEDDGLGRTSIFLNVEGTKNDVSVSYDTKAVKENIKDKAKEEKANLKTILNEEFGLFKKDTSVVKTKKKNAEEQKKKKKKKVSIQWDDD